MMKVKCFVCPFKNKDEECEHSFEEGKGSLEHILLQSLGGKLKTRNLICSKKNLEFGEAYDLEVSDQLKTIKDFMGIKTRTSSKNKPNSKFIALVDLKGNKRPIEAVTYKPFHTIDLYNQDDTYKATLTFKTDEEFEKKRNALLESKKYKIKKDVEESYFLRQFSNKYSTGSNITFQINKEYLLHFLKVAIEYYLYCDFPIKEIEGSVQNFKNEIVIDPEGKFPRVFEYHPDKNIYIPDENEVSHLIHLKIDARNKLIYCMIEYFNFTRTVVILNDNYKGSLNESRNYCYDINTKKTKRMENNAIDLGFDNFNIRLFRSVYSEKNTNVHTNRFNRLWEKIGEDLVTKGLLKGMSEIERKKEGE